MPNLLITNDPPAQVTDELGRTYHLGELLGEGGQGSVWRVERSPKLIIKLLRTSQEASSYLNKFRWVRRLNLRELCVAQPIAVLQPPHIGYVAHFLEGMQPISTLIHPPRDAEVTQWYIDTGGLRRRLRLLAHLGETLAELHALGVIYMDLSPQNAFISSPIHALEAWLIDLDNLSHQVDLSQSIYTYRYGAPEVVTGRMGCTSFSDAWSFAVLIWTTLTLGHPLLGDVIDDGEPSLEERALQGEFPWVGHSEDQTNSSSRSIPQELVISKSLLDTARKTFEVDLTQPALRPGINEWVERLHAAADQTRICAECGSSAYANRPQCPWCDAPWQSSSAQVALRRWDPEYGLVKGLARVISLYLTEEPLHLTLRTTQARSGSRGREPQVRLERRTRGVHVCPCPGHQVWYLKESDAERREPNDQLYQHAQLIEERGITLSYNRYVLLFEAPTQPQRAALIRKS